MGHKGVSIRKPKKSRPFSNADINGSPNSYPDTSQSVHSMVKDNRVTPDMGIKNPTAGSDKKHKKGFTPK